MEQPRFIVKAFWGPRSDSPAEIASRVLRMTKAFGALGPLLESWWVADDLEQDFVPLERARPRLSQVVSDWVARDDFDEPDPSMGYSCALKSFYDNRPEVLDVSVRAGVGHVTSVVDNRILISTSRKLPPDPRLVAYPFLKDLFRVLIETFGATAVIGSYSAQMGNPDFTGLWISPAWMVSLSARNAAQITPPPGVLTERTPDGGLLMSATEEAFDMSNPGHVAAGRAIADALLPIRDRRSL